MLKRTLFLLVCLAGFGIAACGGDDEDGLNDKQANELTDEELVQVCEQFQSASDSSLSAEELEYYTCVLTGEITAGLDTTGMTTCEDVRDMCLEEPQDDPPMTEDPCANPEPTDCTATVGEIRACNQAQLDAFAEIARNAECGMTEEVSEELPSQCDVVLEKCPNFFGDDDGTQQ
jgi:hypothetical protein